MTLVLCSCSKGQTVTGPNSTPSQSALISVSPSPATNLDFADSGQAKPYLVEGELNMVSQDTTRTTGLWRICSPTADNPEEYVQTAIQAVRDLYNFYRKDFTAVLLNTKPGMIVPYAEASFAADGKCATGMTGSVPAKPVFWKARTLDDRPFTNTEAAVAQLWQQKSIDFYLRDQTIGSNYHETALRQYIADALNIPYSETKFRLLKMKDYIVTESPVNQPILERYPNPPIPEAIVQALGSVKIIFNDTEQSKINQMISGLPAGVATQFETQYQLAEQASQDSRWMLFGNWRPYVQSDEYRTVLRFCQEKGQAVWPLLFNKLETENHTFIAGLIIDTIFPEYLCYLAYSEPIGNLENQEGPGNSIESASRFNSDQLIKALLDLL